MRTRPNWTQMPVTWFSVGIWRKKKVCTAAANAVGPHPNGLASVESATNGTPWKSPAPLLPFRVPLLHSRLVSLLSPSMTSVLSKRAPNQPESASSTAFSVGTRGWKVHSSSGCRFDLRRGCTGSIHHRRRVCLTGQGACRTHWSPAPTALPCG